MPLSWRARAYERTCADCGYTWRVPRSATRKPISGYTAVAWKGSQVADGDPEIAESQAISETAAAFGHCPRCGSDDYTQRPVRS